MAVSREVGDFYLISQRLPADDPRRVRGEIVAYPLVSSQSLSDLVLGDLPVRLLLDLNSVLVLLSLLVVATTDLTATFITTNLTAV